MNKQNIVWFEQLGMQDVEHVGGKNASLGEMINHLSKAGVNVPGGFATTAEAYWKFLKQNDLNQRISERLSKLDVDDVNALAKAGKEIREWIIKTPLPSDLQADIKQAWDKLSATAGKDFAVAVRSSATAEDLPDASFAGQQETFLNVRGLDNVIEAIHHVYASLYNDRAIAYRVHQGFAHDAVALSAGIQRMVRSDTGASGVMFSLDTESGFQEVIFITSAYGLGEMVVQGQINPDEFYVHKPTLSAGKPAIIRRSRGSKAQKMIYADQQDFSKAVKIVDVPHETQLQFSLTNEDIHLLAKQALAIEKHYGRPMDIEWGKDGDDGQLYILQARPETVESRRGQVIERFELQEHSQLLCSGRSIGQRIGQGKAKVIKNISEMDRVQPGDVLVTDMTDPDWEPVMKRASAIVTNRGGRTCHAAIIARELGIPAVVGCGDATSQIHNGDDITVCCAEGDTGFIYQGQLKFVVKTLDIENMPKLPLKVMLNVGNPNRAFSFSRLPNAGVGLARLEFIISQMIGIHPKALLNFDRQDAALQAQISERIAGYADPVEFYVEKLKEGIATLGAAFYPKPVIVRLSDFKSNEYAHLLGGQVFEPNEENPMLGYRGASRYVSDDFKACFALECEAVKRVRDEMGLTNVEVMIPFVRTLNEAQQVINILKENGLERGKNALRLIMMCEIPSNAILAEQFLEYFDGFSIGSNDLTQLTLGLDRDSDFPGFRVKPEMTGN